MNDSPKASSPPRRRQELFWWKWLAPMMRRTLWLGACNRTRHFAFGLLFVRLHEFCFAWASELGRPVLSRSPPGPESSGPGPEDLGPGGEVRVCVLTSARLGACSSRRATHTLQKCSSSNRCPGVAFIYIVAPVAWQPFINLAVRV